MLQISQTETPICSATIDQMRLRRAMTLPLVFQNVSSSGFQSEIQVGSFGLIGDFLSKRAQWRALGRPQIGGMKIPMGQSRGTASMASGQAYSSFVPSYRNAKILYISVIYTDRLNFWQALIRMQNLRFAYFLNCDSLKSCAAHKK